MASRYWVGGTGTWDASDTTHWSATSGGAGGASVPGSGDTVTFDGSSGGGTVTLAYNPTVTTITFGAFTGTLDFNTRTLNLGGLLGSGTGIRTLTLGSSTINCSNTAANTVFDFATSTNLTITANTATITLTGAGADFNEGTLNWNGASIVMTGTSNVVMRGTSTWANITRAPSSAAGDNALSLAGDKTCTGTFTLTGFSASSRIQVRSNQSFTLPSTRVITAASVSASYADFMDIQGAGAASWDLSAITGGSGDGGGNSNITFTTPATLYWFGSSGNFADSSKWFLGSGGTGGAGRIPLLQDTARFDANSFASSGQTVTFNMANYGALDCTGMTSGHTFQINGATTQRFFGSMTLASGTSLPATSNAIYYVKRGSGTVTSAGNSFACSMQFQTVGGTVTLGDSLTTSSTQTITLTVGTFNANGYNVTCGLFNSSNSNTRTLTMGSGTWTLTGTGTVWNFGTTTNLTYDAGNSEVVISDTSAATKTLNFANATIAFNVLTIPSSGSGVISFTNTSGNREINMLRVYGTNTLRFSASQTYKIRNFDVPGNAGTVSFVSATPATQYTLSNAGGLVRIFNANITDAIGAGGAIWQAINSVDGGNNTNINFVTERAPSYRVGQKMTSLGGVRPYKKVLHSDYHGYRKMGG